MDHSNELTKHAIRMAKAHVSQRLMFEQILNRREAEGLAAGIYLERLAYHADMAQRWRELA